MPNVVLNTLDVLDKIAKTSIDLGAKAQNVEIGVLSDGSILSQVFSGYYNSVNGKFYEHYDGVSSYTDEITPETNTGYLDIPNNNYYIWDSELATPAYVEANVTIKSLPEALDDIEAILKSGVVTWEQENVLGSKNLIPKFQDAEEGNLRFVVAEDGTITINGLTTSDLVFSVDLDHVINEECYFTIDGDSNLNDGFTAVLFNNASTPARITPFFGGGPSGGGNEDGTAQLLIAENSNIATLKIGLSNNSIFTNFVIKPMLRLSSITDRTFVPYAMTNLDLTNKIKNLRLIAANVEYDNTTSELQALNVQEAIDELTAEKQDLLTFDETPIEGSANPVTSNGIKQAVDGKLETDGSNAVENYASPDVRSFTIGEHENDMPILEKDEEGVAIPIGDETSMILPLDYTLTRQPGYTGAASLTANGVFVEVDGVKQFGVKLPTNVGATAFQVGTQYKTNIGYGFVPDKYNQISLLDNNFGLWKNKVQVKEEYFNLMPALMPFAPGAIVGFRNEIHILGSSNGGGTQHYKWNGTEWVSVSTLPYEFEGEYGSGGGSAVVLNNEIHILGGTQLNIQKHYKWNGTSWSSVSTLPDMSATTVSAIVSENILYLYGYRSLYQWTGSAWNQLSAQGPIDSRGPLAKDVSETLFIPIATTDITTGTVARYYENSWLSVNFLPYAGDRSLIITNKRMMHIFGGVNFSQKHYINLAGAGWKQMPDLPEAFDVINSRITTLNDEIYISNGTKLYYCKYTIDNNIISKDSTISYNYINELPYNFYKGAAVVLNNEIHILGGDDNRTAHYKWDGIQWSEVSTLPYDFYQGSAVVLNNNGVDEIHILGSFATGNTTKHYKWNGTQWSEVSTLPYGFYDGSAVVLNNEIHILGSRSASYLTKHYKWDGAQWSSVSTLPYAFSQGSAVILNNNGVNEIHILGGFYNLVTHYKWNGTQWSKVSTLPHSFFDGSAVVLNNDGVNEIYIFDGTQCYKWDGTQWTFISTLPYNFDGGSTVVLDDKIHILGNYTNRKNHYKMEKQKANKIASLILNYSSKRTLPYYFSNGSAVILNNEIHIIGATLNKKEHYKWDGTQWSSVSTLPYDFYGGSAVVLNNNGTNEIHILGGNDNKTAHYKWDGTQWSEVSILPYSFYGGSAVVLNNEIHILGSRDTSYFTKHYKWDGSSWVQLTNLPYVFKEGAAVVLNDEIHILGTNNSGDYTKHYKLSSGGTGTTVSTLPYSFYEGDAVILNNEIHILGGYNNTNKHYKWDGSSWTTDVSLTGNFLYGKAVVLNNEIHLLGGNGDYAFYHYKIQNSSLKGVYELPYSFDNGSAVVLNNNGTNEIHILGGTNNKTAHYKWDGTQWSEVSILPYSFYQGSAVVLNNNGVDEIHILGSFATGYYTKHYKWDGTQWSEVSILPYSFYQGSAVVLNNEIHILGSSNSGIRHYKWNGTSWVSVSTLPYTFYQGSAVVLNNEIHILGSKSASGYYTKHYKWDGTQWSEVSTLPYAFYQGSAVVLNNEIHILGSGYSSSYYKKHYKWDGTQWIEASALPCDFYQGSAVVLNDEIYLICSSNSFKIYYMLQNIIIIMNTIINSIYNNTLINQTSYITNSIIGLEKKYIILKLNNQRISLPIDQIKLTQEEELDLDKCDFSVYAKKDSNHSGYYIYDILLKYYNTADTSPRLICYQYFSYNDTLTSYYRDLQQNITYVNSIIEKNNNVYTLVEKQNKISIQQITNIEGKINFVNYIDTNIDVIDNLKTSSLFMFNDILYICDGHSIYSYNETNDEWTLVKALPEDISFIWKNGISGFIDCDADNIYFADNITKKIYILKDNNWEVLYDLDENTSFIGFQNSKGEINLSSYTCLLFYNQLGIPTQIVTKLDDMDIVLDNVSYKVYNDDLTVRDNNVNTYMMLEYDNKPELHDGTLLIDGYGIDVKYLPLDLRFISRLAYTANKGFDNNGTSVTRLTYVPTVDVYKKKVSTQSRSLIKLEDNAGNNSNIIINTNNNTDHEGIISVGNNITATNDNQILLGTSPNPSQNDALAVGNGLFGGLLSNLFSVDTRGNFNTPGGMIWKQGRLKGVLIANSPYWFDLEDGSSYIIFITSRQISNNAYRGIHVYYISSTWPAQDTGAQTCASGVGRAIWIALGSNGTAGFTSQSIAVPYVYTDPGTGTTYQRYHNRIGIGSCTTAFDVRFSMIKVMGSVDDFD